MLKLVSVHDMFGLATCHGPCMSWSLLKSMNNISTAKTKEILKKSDANNCSIIHYMLAIGVSKSTPFPNGNSLWGLFESYFEPSEWSKFLKQQLEGTWSKIHISELY